MWHTRVSLYHYLIVNKTDFFLPINKTDLTQIVIWCKVCYFFGKKSVNKLLIVFFNDDFRALHETQNRAKGGLTRLQFFLLVLTASFAYYIVPNYFFPSITALSFVCWIWKDSVTAQQIGSGLRGLGIGSFALDWNTVAGFLGSPLATPGFAIVNTMVGFFIVLYIAIPITYWTNTFDAKRFPLFSSHVFDSTGATYNVSRILNSDTFKFNQQEYDSYSKIYLSTVFTYTYALSFATLAATVSHVVLFHGRYVI